MRSLTGLGLAAALLAPACKMSEEEANEAFDRALVEQVAPAIWSAADALDEAEEAARGELADADVPDAAYVELRRAHYADTDVVAREWSVRVDSGGLAVRHGKERHFHPNGQLKSEREWREGSPAGEWRTYFPSGQIESQVVLRDDAERSPATWWYEDGSVSAEGWMVAGVRTGHWTYYWPDGTKESEGSWVDAWKEGLWREWFEDGTPRSEGHYYRGLRVGTWKLWTEEGELRVKQGPAPPETERAEALDDDEAGPE